MYCQTASGKVDLLLVRCYNLSLICPNSENINILIDIVVNNRLEFNANGFFKIRSNIILHMLGSSLMFIIIIVQFNADQA